MARRQGLAEVVDLVKAYVRQELLGPLQGAGRWISMGLAGSLALVVGVILLLLSLLRALQTETGTVFRRESLVDPLPDRGGGAGRGDCTAAAPGRQEGPGMSTASKESERIGRDSLEEALRDLQADIDRETQPLLVRVAYGAAAAAGVLIGVAYLLGRRAGRLRRTVVEVRRI